MSTYDDIIHLPRPVSPRHAPMSMLDRAAQFSPFAALTGHDAAIAETARLTDTLFTRDDQSKEQLNEKLNLLSQQIRQQPQVKITYFLPDHRKDGGAYLTVTTIVKAVDPNHSCLILPDYSTIPFSHILDLESDIFPKD